MKKILFYLILGTAFACNKPSDTDIVDPPVTNSNTNTTPTGISTGDSIATASMRTSLSMMQSSLDSMLGTPHHNQQLHWDSLYHHHDSAYWHHHNNYHHETYTHDDHHHAWVAYDPNLDHTHHHHHLYPGHEHDSLTTTNNHHSHSNTDHHFNGHDMHEHHVLDSLHNQHQNHHP